ncbi:MAG TPA: hypothetical protein VJ552_05310 [Sediminibacterium sp.]|nr:hypothetical protein [Sediminibacterium sp.]
MIITELPLSFPIYSSQQLQNRYRENCSGIPYKLISPTDAILPFQMYFAGTIIKPISEWKIYSETGSMIKDISSSISTHLRTEIRGDKQFTWYNGTKIADLSLGCGFYEMRIAFTGITGYYYSEIFYVAGFERSQASSYLKLTYRNEDNIGPIQYEDTKITVSGVDYDFQNIIYLDSFITHTDPLLEIETEKDGFNNELVTFSKFNNRLLTEVVVPDYLKTALLMVQLHKSVVLELKNSSRILAISRVMVKTQQMTETAECTSLTQLTFEDNC